MWVYPTYLPFQEISEEEKNWKQYLSPNAFNNFKFSRGYLRLGLSELFKIPPLEVPVLANPGEQPLLTNNNGYLSLSHSKEVLILAWAPLNIGIDIENKNRNFQAEKICSKFFHDFEKEELSKIDQSLFQKEVLKYWIIKEAAFKWQLKKNKVDFFHWEWSKDVNIALHKKKQLKVRTYLINYQDYFLGVAYNS